MAATNFNNFAGAPGTWIVDPTAGKGNFTTITAAVAAASSGETIFIRPGTYTENLTLKAGVNLAAMDSDALTPNVLIIGKLTYTAAGAVSISGIKLQTNGDYFLVVSGSNASIVNLTNCNLSCTNNSGINYTSSSSSSSISIFYSQCEVSTTGITPFVMTSAGTINLNWSAWTNGGGSTTASTLSSGLFIIRHSVFNSPVSTSSTGAVAYDHMRSTISNATALTTAGTGTSTIKKGLFTTGTASAISIGAGTNVTLTESEISSSNANAITGAGTLFFGSLIFTGSSSTINTTTQTPLISQTGDSIFNAIGNSTTTVTVNGAADSNGANIKLISAGSNPNKYIRANNTTGNLQVVNSAYSAAVFDLSDTGVISTSTWNGVAVGTQYGGTGQNFSASTGVMQLAAGTASASTALANGTTATTQSAGNNSTSVATTAYVDSTFQTGGTFTPTLDGATPGSTTYSSQVGYYIKTGNVVTIYGRVVGSAATGTGNAVFGALPFTVKNQSLGNWQGSMFSASSATWTWAGGTQITTQAQSNTTNIAATISGSAFTGAFLQMFNAAFNFQYSSTYQV